MFPCKPYWCNPACGGRGLPGPTGAAGEGDVGPTGAQGATGPQGPPGFVGLAAAHIDGFSAFVTSPSPVAADTQLTNWSTGDPYFPGAGFDPVSGTYTVPVTGKYAVKATINYSTVTSASIAAGVSPSFVVRRTSPATAELLTGVMPILDVVASGIRAVLDTATVVLTGDVRLSAGDVVGVFYIADGLNVSVLLGGAGSAGIVWSMSLLS